jgi:hypothetical protein
MQVYFLRNKSGILLQQHDIVWNLASYFLKRFKLPHQVQYDGPFWLRQKDAVNYGDSSCNRVTGEGFGHWNAYRVLNTQKLQLLTSRATYKTPNVRTSLYCSI